MLINRCRISQRKWRNLRSLRTSAPAVSKTFPYRTRVDDVAAVLQCLRASRTGTASWCRSRWRRSRCRSVTAARWCCPATSTPCPRRRSRGWRTAARCGRPTSAAATWWSATAAASCASTSRKWATRRSTSASSRTGSARSASASTSTCTVRAGGGGGVLPAGQEHRLYGHGGANLKSVVCTSTNCQWSWSECQSVSFHSFQPYLKLAASGSNCGHL